MPGVSPNCGETGCLSRRVRSGANDGHNAREVQAGLAVARGAGFRPIYTMVVHCFSPPHTATTWAPNVYALGYITI